MRTLATQVRLRRLIRVHGEYTERLAATPADGELAQLARGRLLQLADDVRRSWRTDLAATGIGGTPSLATVVAGHGNFGDVLLNDFAESELTICPRVFDTSAKAKL